MERNPRVLPALNFALLCLAAFLTLAQVAVAQAATTTAAGDTATTSSDLPVLLFDEALAQAEAQNSDLRAARARLRQSDELSAQAWSGYFPTLDLTAGYTRNAYDASIGVPAGYVVRDLGAPQGPVFDPSRPPGSTNPPGAQTTQVAVPVNVQSIALQRKDQWNAQAHFSQALIAPTQWVAIRNAYLAERTFALTAENVRRELLYVVARGYLGAASLREAVAVQRELLQVRRSFEQDAESKLGIGVVTKVALLRAQIDRTVAEQNLVRSQHSYQAAKSSLAALLSRAVDFEVATPTSEVTLPIEAADVERSQRRALDMRPDIAAARLSVEVAAGQKRGVKARYLPSLALTGSYGLSSVPGFSGHRDTWRIGVGLSWSLFDGGLRQAQLREASARITEAEATRDGHEHRARDEVRRARLDLDSAEANRIKAQEQARLARETAQLVRKNFEAGVATYIEVTDANAALSNAELGGVAESLSVRLARLNLMRAMGAFDPSSPGTHTVP